MSAGPLVHTIPRKKIFHPNKTAVPPAFLENLEDIILGSCGSCDLHGIVRCDQPQIPPPPHPHHPLGFQGCLSQCPNMWRCVHRRPLICLTRGLGIASDSGRAEADVRSPPSPRPQRCLPLPPLPRRDHQLIRPFSGRPDGDMRGLGPGGRWPQRG